MSATLTGIESHLQEYLKVAAIADYCPNGVQVRGREPVGKIVTGVSACMALFEAAVEEKADLVLVHHGLFWDKESQVVEGSRKRRLKFLLEHDLTLMAYHLPLDGHPQLGNNIQILNKLDLTVAQPFGDYRGFVLSFIGRTAKAVTIEAFAERVERLFGGQPLVLPAGPEWINRVAVCSGGAPEMIREAKNRGADLFLSGEAAEPVFHYAHEEGIHFIAAGHHRTEMFGVQALGEHLAERFGVVHQFIDIPNPI